MFWLFWPIRRTTKPARNRWGAVNYQFSFQNDSTSIAYLSHVPNEKYTRTVLLQKFYNALKWQHRKRNYVVHASSKNWQNFTCRIKLSLLTYMLIRRCPPLSLMLWKLSSDINNKLAWTNITDRFYESIKLLSFLPLPMNLRPFRRHHAVLP